MSNNTRPSGSLYFLPGRGEKPANRIEQFIATLGYANAAREMSGEFYRLRFSEQLDLIRSDLVAGFWEPNANLVGRSFGAYLLLQALADMDSFPGRLLLLSPVLGAAVANNGFYVSRPPRADKILQLAEGNGFPAPNQMEIHTGAADNGCDPSLAVRFAAKVGNTQLHVVPEAGHKLGEEYTRSVLRKFLSPTSQTV